MARKAVKRGGKILSGLIAGSLWQVLSQAGLRQA